MFDLSVTLRELRRARSARGKPERDRAWRAVLSLIALQNPQDTAVKKSAKRAMKLLRGTAADLP